MIDRVGSSAVAHIGSVFRALRQATLISSLRETSAYPADLSMALGSFLRQESA
jgi:hypothetical protein